MAGELFEKALEEQREKFKEFKKAEAIIDESQRASGRTTRGIDEAIQTLFLKGEVVLKDHHENGNNDRMNNRFSELFEARFRREHKNTNIRFDRHGGVLTAKIIKR
jgi:hypothetical protein